MGLVGVNSFITPAWTAMECAMVLRWEGISWDRAIEVRWANGDRATVKDPRVGFVREPAVVIELGDISPYDDVERVVFVCRKAVKAALKNEGYWWLGMTPAILPDYPESLSGHRHHVGPVSAWDFYKPAQVAA